jgi:hypothetical protein
MNSIRLKKIYVESIHKEDYPVKNASDGALKY